MSQPERMNWELGFPELVGHPERYVECQAHVALDVTAGVTAVGGPSVVIGLQLPDGRMALAGVDLVGLIGDLMAGAAQCGLFPVIALRGLPEPPDHTSN